VAGRAAVGAEQQLALRDRGEGAADLVRVRVKVRVRVRVRVRIRVRVRDRVRDRVRA
jgi:hypothetical protein